MLAVVAARPVALTVQAQDEITRWGLLAQLRHRPEVELVGDAASASATVTVVIADEVDDDALRRVRGIRRCSASRVVLIVSKLDQPGLMSAVEAGACSLLRRGEATPDSVVGAVQAAAAGSGSLPPDLVGVLLEHLGRVQREVLRPRGLTFSGITEREVAVLRLIADGCDTSEVGRQLFVSERTVKSILHDVTSRLSLRNRTHAVAYALRQGLI